MKNRKVPKSQKQYVRGIIHNFSLQRWTYQEITDYLNNEKGTSLSRSAVTQIRSRMEKHAENGISN